MLLCRFYHCFYLSEVFKNTFFCSNINLCCRLTLMALRTLSSKLGLGERRQATVSLQIFLLMIIQPYFKNLMRVSSILSMTNANIFQKFLGTYSQNVLLMLFYLNFLKLFCNMNLSRNRHLQKHSFPRISGQFNNKKTVFIGLGLTVI